MYKSASRFMQTPRAALGGTMFALAEMPMRNLRGLKKRRKATKRRTRPHGCHPKGAAVAPW
jgi:hypothetical protein